MNLLIRVIFTLFLLTPALWGIENVRIVSLAPSLTEIVFALGKGNSLAGVSAFCDYPEAARTLPRTGGINNTDIEAVVRLRPTLVLASYSGNSRETVEKLERRGIRVLTLKERNLEDILSNIVIIARVLDTDPAPLLTGLTNSLRSAVKKSDKGGAVMLLSVSPFYCVSTNTFLSDLLERAGYVNMIKSPLSYPALSREDLLRLRPPTVIMMSALSNDAGTVRKIFEKSGRVPGFIFIDTDMASRPGPRVFDVLKELRR